MKIAIVTGASSGIGAELARQLAESEVKVYAVARREGELRALQAAYPEYIIPIVADLGASSGIDVVVTAVAGLEINYLVNNAAILGVKPLSELNFDELQSLLAINTIAPTLLTNRLFQQLSADGRILNISSRAASVFTEGLTGYCMSKASLDILTAMTRKELCKEHDILVASFIPGEVETQMQEQLRQFPPVSDVFQQAKDAGLLISAQLSAQCMAWLLLKSSREQYLSAVSIYNSEHHSHWLREGQEIFSPQKGATGLPSLVEGSRNFGLKNRSGPDRFSVFHHPLEPTASNQTALKTNLSF